MQGCFLIIELLLPSRNPLMLYLWWQYLQMRYLLDQSGSIKRAFTAVDTSILQLISHRQADLSIIIFYADCIYHSVVIPFVPTIVSKYHNMLLVLVLVCHVYFKSKVFLRLVPVQSTCLPFFLRKILTLDNIEVVDFKVRFIFHFVE